MFFYWFFWRSFLFKASAWRTSLNCSKNEKTVTSPFSIFMLMPAASHPERIISPDMVEVYTLFIFINFLVNWDSKSLLLGVKAYLFFIELKMDTSSIWLMWDKCAGREIVVMSPILENDSLIFYIEIRFETIPNQNSICIFANNRSNLSCIKFKNDVPPKYHRFSCHITFWRIKTIH